LFPYGRKVFRWRIGAATGDAWGQIMMRQFLRRLLIEDRAGATLIELCFLAALVAVAIISSVQIFSTKLNNTFYIVATSVVAQP
jgi:Flp pilus assembly pilin Flp